MKKLTLVFAALLLFGFLSSLQAQMISGTFQFNTKTPEYGLHKDDGKRMVELEIEFTKPFEKKPKLVLGTTMIDSENKTKMKYSIVAKSISRDGFIIRATVWGDTKINAVAGSWIAHVEE